MRIVEKLMRHVVAVEWQQCLEKKLFVSICFTSAVVFVGWIYLVVGHFFHFDGYFANGAFQLFNPLRRLMDGQVPGKDFVVFHGIGTVLLHLPFYFLFGQDLQASEISRFSVSGLLHLIACVWLWSVLRNRINGWAPVILSLLFFLGAALALDRIFLPQNSLLGTRSAVPIYVALAMVGSQTWIRLALLAGFALIVSPEHGVATIAGLAACAGMSPFRNEEGPTASRFIICIAAACVTYYIVVSLLCNGEVAGNIEYALIDVPTDQFWYFGVRPNAYLPGDYGILLSSGYLTFASLWFLGLFVTVRTLPSKSTFSMAAIFLFVYATFGTISQFGYLFHGNLQGSERALILISIFGLTEVHRKNAITLFAGCGFVGFLLLGYVGRDAIAYSWPAKRPETGEFLSPYWRQHLASIERLAPYGTIWSVYAGLPEASRNRYAPSFDYIIHALGPKNRSNYGSTFDTANPDLVRLDNAKTWAYGWWLISSNWDFYRRVFLAYELAYEDKMSTLWIRKTNSLPLSVDTPILSKIAGNCLTITDVSNFGGVHELILSYSVANPWSKMPIIGQTPRLIISTDRLNDSGVSLPPPSAYIGNWIIPLVLKPGEKIKMCARVDTFLPRVIIKLSDVEIATVPITESARQYLVHIWK